jgi:hypothetical protein
MMQRYSFRVTRGKDIQQEITSDLPENQAARSEKPLPIFSDLARNFAHKHRRKSRLAN